MQIHRQIWVTLSHSRLKYLTRMLWNNRYVYALLHFKSHFIEREVINEQPMH